MKYLLVLLVIMVAVGIWRSRNRAERLNERRPGPPQGRGLQNPQDMVACAHCGLHLPRSDALVQGATREVRYYCCAQHRTQGPT